MTVHLAPAASVPEGFVFVPAGRFLWGTAGGEEVRGFFGGPPLHAAETGAFLIARDETTYADWIAFLRSLSGDERRLRTPGARDQGFVVALAELPDGGFELTIGPEGHPYTARTGALLRYPGRRLRAEQDWSRLPVSGVSFDDALAYAAWLDRTGRVPGARPCDEREWERAARGADDRAFPGGDQLDPDDANHDLTYGRDPLGFGPDMVGSHPASDSPFGVHDLAGNVWEWTTSAEPPGAPVLRGGGFYQRSLDSRCENRQAADPAHRSVFVGARICATSRRRDDAAGMTPARRASLLLELPRLPRRRVARGQLESSAPSATAGRGPGCTCPDSLWVMRPVLSSLNFWLSANVQPYGVRSCRCRGARGRGPPCPRSGPSRRCRATWPSAGCRRGAQLHTLHRSARALVAALDVHAVLAVDARVDRVVGTPQSPDTAVPARPRTMSPTERADHLRHPVHQGMIGGRCDGRATSAARRESGAPRPGGAPGVAAGARHRSLWALRRTASHACRCGRGAACRAGAARAWMPPRRGTPPPRRCTASERRPGGLLPPPSGSARPPSPHLPAISPRSRGEYALR